MGLVRSGVLCGCHCRIRRTCRTGMSSLATHNMDYTPWVPC